jgi:hypothetical protein
MGYQSIEVDDYGSLEEALSKEIVGGEIVKMILREEAYYCAVKVPDGVEAAVVLEMDDDGFRMFKHIPEYAVPVACVCPIEILRLLTPTENVDANVWRERCWTWNIEVVNAALNGPLNIAQRLNEQA